MPISETPAVVEEADPAAFGRSGWIEIDAWFPADTSRETAEPGEAWREGGVELTAVEPVGETDWLAPWRAAAQPFEVGRRFLLDPREPDLPEPPDAAEPRSPSGDRIVLRLPARAAFGTGSHESTRLALELLETAEVAGRSVLDVGTGTGILAFAALALGARRAAACDVDPVAAFHARDNRRLNGAALPAAGRFAVWAGGAAALSPGARFDLLLVNVLPERILGELPRLAAATAPGGALVYSGLVAEREAELAAAWAACGLAVRGRATAGGWVALLLGPAP
jgi:ribosomal protein L11 methyltransferase